MDVSQVTGTHSQGYLTEAVNSELGKEEFLSLLITQLQNQDPLDPMDNSEFVAQLAQFSSLEQMTNLNSSYAEQSALIQSMNNNLTASFVGQEVIVSADTFTLQEAGTAKVGAYLEHAAAQVEIHILDINGQTVRTLHLENLPAGTNVVQWDGLDSSGRPVSGGTYAVAIEAADVLGNELDVYALIGGRVESVSFDHGAAYLSVAGTQVPIGTLIQVLSGAAAGNPPAGATHDAGAGDDGADLPATPGNGNAGNGDAGGGQGDVEGPSIPGRSGDFSAA
jgi:flagellar basal-body rod modification protein FlgD